MILHRNPSLAPGPYATAPMPLPCRLPSRQGTQQHQTVVPGHLSETALSIRIEVPEGLDTGVAPQRQNQGGTDGISPGFWGV